MPLLGRWPSLFPVMAAALGGSLVAAALASGLWWLAPFGVAVFALGLEGSGRVQALGLGWLAGLPLSALSSHGISHYDPWLWALAAVAYALVWGVWALVLSSVPRAVWSLVAPPLLTLLERLVGSPEVLGRLANPAGSLAYTQTDGPMLALAPFGGTALVCAVTVAVGLGFAALVRGRTMGAATALIAPAIVTLTLASGVQPGQTRVSSVTVSVPQAGAQPQLEDALGVARVARMGLRGSADLTVFPESAFYPLETEAVIRGLLGAHPSGRSTVMFNAFHTQNGLMFSAILALQVGHVRIAGFKRDLLPQAEDTLASGTFGAPVVVGGVRLRPLVCWDAFFPEHAKAAAEGADALVVLANDAFAGDSDTPFHHLRAARWRAAENHVSVIFASQTGPSALIDPNGRVLGSLAHGQSGVLTGVVPSGLSHEVQLSTAVIAVWLGGVGLISVFVQRLRFGRKLDRRRINSSRAEHSLT